MHTEQDYQLALLQAAGRLQNKTLFAPGDGLSVRLPGEDAFLLLTGQTGNGETEIARHPVGIPWPGDDGIATQALHGLIYDQRPDVGAVLLNRQTWATALSHIPTPMPGVFDEQVRHLGHSVATIGPVADPAAIRAALKHGANAHGLGGRALCLGMTLERLVFNAELLEKCAKAFVLASSSGLQVGRIPWLVRWIANGRLKKDQQRAAASYARGQAPARSTAY
ncbi:class II aldolase/adducin family protein [Chitinimonas naiadis]